MGYQTGTTGPIVYNQDNTGTAWLLHGGVERIVISSGNIQDHVSAASHELVRLPSYGPSNALSRKEAVK